MTYFNPDSEVIMLLSLILLAAIHQDSMQKVLDEDIYPSDIFACIREHDCTKPIRGWKLSTREGWNFSGSLDGEEGRFEAVKGKEHRYFWYLIQQGVDPKNGQSLDETRVKELESVEENPYTTDLQRRGLWSKDRSLAWMDNWCIAYPEDNLSMGDFPVTKEDCEKHTGWKECISGKCRNIGPVKLFPYSQTHK